MSDSIEHTPTESPYADVRRVLLSVLIANLTITSIKIILGVVTGAIAVVADGFHSLVDSSSNLIGLAVIRLARRPADEAHPYGYRRYESLGALAIGGLLVAAAWEIGSAIVDRLISGGQPEFTLLGIILIVLTFPVNVLVVVLETRAGKRLNSQILLADAKHTQTDLYVTGGVVASMLGVWLGWMWLDVVTASVVVVLILRAAYQILNDTSRWLADEIIIDPSKIEAIALGISDVLRVNRIRSRGTPNTAYVDLHIKVHEGMSTSQAHAIASEVEDRIIHQIPEVVDVLVHIEPATDESMGIWRSVMVQMRQIADGMGLGLHDVQVQFSESGGLSIELHLEIPGDCSLNEGHRIAKKFEERVTQQLLLDVRMRAHLEPILADVVVPEFERFPQFREEIMHTLTKIIAYDNVREVELQMVSGRVRCTIRVCLPGETLLSDGHNLAEEIEREIMNQHELVDRVLVHVEPDEGDA